MGRMKIDFEGRKVEIGEEVERCNIKNVALVREVLKGRMNGIGRSAPERLNVACFERVETREGIDNLLDLSLLWEDVCC